MKLNLLNPTVVVAGVLAGLNRSDLNARFGRCNSVDNETFKYTVGAERCNNVLIARVNLAELFDGIELDMTQFTFGDPPPLESQLKLFPIDEMNEELLVMPYTAPLQVPGDNIGDLFECWLRMTGVRGLTRLNVELSTLDGYLTIDANNSTYYTGLIRVKYQ